MEDIISKFDFNRILKLESILINNNIDEKLLKFDSNIDFEHNLINFLNKKELMEENLESCKDNPEKLIVIIKNLLNERKYCLNSLNLLNEEKKVFLFL